MPEKPRFKGDVRTKLEQLMMRGVQDRYALLYSWGLDHNILSRVDLSGDPHGVAINAEVRIRDYLGSNFNDDYFEELIMNSPVPDDFPDLREGS